MTEDERDYEWRTTTRRLGREEVDAGRINENGDRDQCWFIGVREAQRGYGVHGPATEVRTDIVEAANRPRWVQYLENPAYSR